MMRFGTALVLALCLLGVFLACAVDGRVLTNDGPYASASTYGEAKAVGGGFGATFGKSSTQGASVAKAGTAYKGGKYGYSKTGADAERKGPKYDSSAWAGSSTAAAGYPSKAVSVDYSKASKKGAKAGAASAASGKYAAYTSDYAGTKYNDNYAGASASGVGIGYGKSATAAYSKSDKNSAASGTKGYAAGKTATTLQKSAQKAGGSEGFAVAAGSAHNGYVKGFTGGKSEPGSSTNYAGAAGKGDVVVVGSYTHSSSSGK